MRFLKTLAALIIVLAIISFVLAVYFAKFNSQSFLGESLREKFIKYPVLVSLMNLNVPGDLKNLYLNPKTETINVNLVYDSDYPPNKKASLWIKDMIFQTTDKNALIKISNDLIVNDNSSSTTNDLNKFRAKFTKSNLASPQLSVIYVALYGEKESLAGIVLHKDTIFIFRKALYSLSEDKETLERLEKSTLMHEWGHLLGLEHSKNDDCIMSETVEVYDRHMLGARQIPDEYCQDTIFELQRFQNDLK